MNTSKKTAVIIFVGLFLGTMFTSVAQIGHGGLPYSFKKSNILSEVATELLPYRDNNALLEAEIAVTSKQEGFVFGKEIAVNYHLENSGAWENLPDGGRLWRLGIASIGAVSLNLLFDSFYIPPHSHLFIYTEDRSFIMGKFTEANNNQWGNFATSLFPSDEIVLEYYESPQDYGKGIIQVSTVVHGYKDFLFRKGSYGTENGKCHIDANCEEGNKYPNAKRAVAVMVRGGRGFCTGTLLNNTAQDGKPYFLTAFHCLDANMNRKLEPSEINSIENSVFVFNYESTDCNQNTEKQHYSINGCVLLATDSFSDFALLLLNDKPTKDFNAYYAGWDSRNIAVTGAFCFHHPMGDMKKFSKNNKLLDSSKFEEDDSYPNNTHWKVTTWDMGSTEGGSSGSALFNDLQQVIGQLEGGTAKCSGTKPDNGFDLYGKFSYSWTNGNNPKISARLDYWLDSLKTGQVAIQGYDPHKKTNAVNGFEQITNDISLFPNPANDKLRIEMSDIRYSISDIRLYDVLGREAPFNSPEGGKLPSFGGAGGGLIIDISHLPAGIYIMEIQTEKCVVHKKLCVQR